MESRGYKTIQVQVQKLKELSEPKGFNFYKVILSDEENNIPPTEQFIFFDGKYITPTFQSIETKSELAQEIAFDFSATDIDASDLSLLYGSKGAKNIIVKITDFECPYCRRANSYLETKLNGRDDAAIYIMHFPLPIHNNAVPFAKAFEAGVKLGKNFSHELFTNEELLNMTEAEIIDHFAAKSGSVEQFKQHYESPEIAERIKSQQQRAQDMGVNATPVIYINGKKIEGFNPSLIDRGLAGFK
jgi:glutaredoxin